MEVKTIEFRTLSPVIVSSRMETALYRGVDFKELDKSFYQPSCSETLSAEDEKIQILYQMYNRENRGGDENASLTKAQSYYIPASSLKGAWMAAATRSPNESVRYDVDEDVRRHVLFQDVEINSSYVVLSNLYKFQYLYQKPIVLHEGQDKKIYKTPKFERFFPNVAVEMVKRDAEFAGEVFLKSGEILTKELIKRIADSTKSKLGRYIGEVDKKLYEIQTWNLGEDGNECLQNLKRIKKALEQEVNSQKNLFFLGGFKGLLASLSNDVNERNTLLEIRNGFYIDSASYLPYGLVEIVG